MLSLKSLVRPSMSLGSRSVVLPLRSLVLMRTGPLTKAWEKIPISSTDPGGQCRAVLYTLVIDKVLVVPICELFWSWTLSSIAPPLPPPIVSAPAAWGQSFRDGVLVPLSGNRWSYVNTLPASKLNWTKRTVAGRVNGGFLLPMVLFHSLTKAIMRAFAMGAKSTVSGGSIPPVAISTNLSGLPAIEWPTLERQCYITRRRRGVQPNTRLT